MNILKENISTRDLMAFVALIRTGSFTAAAGMLNITQSAVSKRVAELEQKLAVRLLDRSTRRLELTAEGRAFVISAEAILQQFEQSVGQLRSLAQGSTGELRLCSASNMSTQIVAPVVGGFIETNPRVRLSLYDCQTRKQMIEHIANGSSDVGLIGGLPNQDHELSGEFDLTEIAMVREPMIVCFAHGHPLEKFERVAWEQVSAYPRIGLRSKFGIGHVTGVIEQLGHLGERYVMSVTMINTAIALASAGVGVAIFPCYVVRGGRPNISWRPIEGTEHDYNFNYVHLRGKALSGASRVFGEHLRAFLSKMPATTKREGAS
ncbi:LysR family transcriptional regulator [Pseudotabrizicola alkalilacus]|uniref:LysR family transcriptional regulator n=1 Tax=Pseudotabrizicola alkalilacus TaxID=2305252 RepID=UPI00131450D5|nr:LysR family transcriptional regulator [Pseudotabrizicola alkalilacus]